ncbi:MAG TPA: SCO family protein [Anaerolineaceae bacterium]
MRRSMIWVGLAILLTVLAVTAYAVSRPYVFHGSTIQQPYAAPDITLADGRGGQFHLADERGSLVFVFFGFTHCPDVCPTTMAMMKQIHDRLGKDASRVQVVFVTVDPDRDTQDQANKYATGFDPAFYGLSGSEAQLDPIWSAYGVYRKLDKSSPTDTNYDVEHSTQLYLIDENGNLRLTFPYGTPVDQVLQDVRYLLKQG